jgi:DNA-binding NarL/FixJ family response regulator
MRVLVVDNDPLILDALKRLLPQLTPGTEIVLARDRTSAAVALDEDPRFELLLLDLALPGAPGLDFLTELKQRYPGMSIVVLSAPHDDETIYAALAVGAQGFVPKTANINSLQRALRRVLEGGVTKESASGPQGDGVHMAPAELRLTLRQADVLKQLVQGKPNKLISRDLRLSEGKVKGDVSAILKALQVHTRTQAVAELARRGISVETLSRHRGR